MASELTDENGTYEMATCAVHGEYKCRLNKIFNRVMRLGCTECNRIKNEEEARQALESKIVLERYQLSVKLGAALIPKRFKNKTFDAYETETPQQEAALAKCIAYAEDFEDHKRVGRCMLLLGKPGTGKTHLAIAIANDIMTYTQHTAVYRTLGGVLHDIRESYDSGAQTSEAWIIKGLVTPSLLVLDEIGVSKEKPSDFELTTLFSIINGRYERELPTVIVSNLGPKELAQSIGERSADRLREGGVIVLPFTWESQRGKEGF